MLLTVVPSDPTSSAWTPRWGIRYAYMITLPETCHSHASRKYGVANAAVLCYDVDCQPIVTHSTLVAIEREVERHYGHEPNTTQITSWSLVWLDVRPDVTVPPRP